MSSPAKCILLVGHCNVDGPRLQKVLGHEFKQARIERINSQADLERAVSAGADLLLINREPVGFAIEGMQIIRDLQQMRPQAKVMLISDFPEAQAQALLAGALQGFGKSQLGTQAIKELVAAALE